MPNGLKQWAIWGAAQTVLTVVFNTILKLADNAVIGWVDDQIGKALGLPTPSISAVMSWAIPFAVAGLTLWAYHFTQITRKDVNNTVSPPESYLSDVDTEITTAIYCMAYFSSWAKWYASQFITNHETHRPAAVEDIINIVAYKVTQALMNGKLRARGRFPGNIEYEVIPKETWRLAALSMKRHPVTLWKATVIPRGDVDPVRIARICGYDSLVVNSSEFEALWPKSNRKTDAARMQILKKAAKEGANQEYIKILREGRISIWL